MKLPSGVRLLALSLLVAVVALIALGAVIRLTGDRQSDDRSPSADIATTQTATDAARTERLVGLATLWGAVKYFHPYLAHRPIDWDAALVDAVPRVAAAASVEEYREALNALLASLGDPATRIAPTSAATTAPERGAIAPQPSVRWLDGDVAVVTAADYDQLLSVPLRQFGLAVQGRQAITNDEKLTAAATALRNAFTEAAGARAIVIDARRLDPGSGGPAESGIAAAYRSVFAQALPPLLVADLPVASRRHVVHSGYAAQSTAVPASTGYYSAYATTGGETITAAPTGAGGAAITVLVNQHTAGIHDILGGMQAQGIATVIHDGDPAQGGGGDTFTLSLPSGLTAVVRASELVNPDGTLGFAPDVTVPATGARSPGDDPAMETALDLARGGERPAPSSRERAALTPAYPREKPYAEMAHPSPEYRLLSLFRFWNVINYFFPYTHLLDYPWAEVLREFIPRFESVADEQAYTLTVAELVSRIQDTHGIVSGPLVTRHLPTGSPPITAAMVEGQSVVTHVSGGAGGGQSELHPGDVILAVDGEAIGDRRDRLARLIAASTPQALAWRVHQRLLAGARDSTVTLTVQHEDGSVAEVELQRAGATPRPPRTSAVFSVLPSGFGYIDLERLEPAQLDRALEAIRETPGLILDMRGYPRGIFPLLGPRLAGAPAVAARFDRREPHGVDPLADTRLRFDQMVEPSGQNRYAGKIVVLINEEAISQAEHTCLWLEAAADVTFIGTPTHGANGDITNTVLPGGITVIFTGQQVRHGDGRQLQRVGIQPHIRVEPTIAGIRGGRDEVLEAAVDFLTRTASER